MTSPQAPHDRILADPPLWGETLVNLLSEPEGMEEARARAAALTSLQLSERSACDLELLATGAFTPLDRFMGPADYRRGLEEMRLANGTTFPIPVTLPLPRDAAMHLDQSVALRDSRNHLLATLDITEVFEGNWQEEAANVLGTRDSSHPLVTEMASDGGLKVSGRPQVLELPRRYDFQELRLTPTQTRRQLESLGVSNVIAFQSPNPLRPVHEELMNRAAQELDGVVFLHPMVGMAKTGDVEHFTRIRTYKALAACYHNPKRILLSVVQLATRARSLVARHRATKLGRQLSDRRT